MDWSNRAVFIDIDGVLAPWGRAETLLDAECLRRLRMLHDVAMVVLSSSWPERAARIYGVPFDDALHKEERRSSERARVIGILRYLSEHPEIQRWVSIDDDHQDRVLDMLEMSSAERETIRPRLIRTDWTMARGAGLTWGVYARALSALGIESSDALREKVFTRPWCKNHPGRIVPRPNDDDQIDGHWEVWQIQQDMDLEDATAYYAARDI